MKNILQKILWPLIALALSFSPAAAYTTTTNYAFKLPQVNNAIDQDQWGDYLNSNISSLDSLLLTASNAVHASISTSTALDNTYQNKIVEVNASGGAVTITLPAVAGTGDGWAVTVKKTDSSTNAVTVKGNSSDLIDGGNTDVLSTQYWGKTYVSDTSVWNIKNVPPTVTGIVKTVHQQVFTAGGTYTPTTGMLYARVQMVGGGASGGGAAASGTGANSGGGGGGGGEYAESVVTAAQVGASQAVTIGTGGAAPSAGNNPGNNGGQTSLGTLIIAPGGTAGGGGTHLISGASGAGGTGGTGTILIPGQPGSVGFSQNGSSGSASAAGTAKGGDSGLGYGAQSQIAFVNSIAGSAGSNYGGGGAGGEASGQASTDIAGGAGAPGIVIITEYCSQ